MRSAGDSSHDECFVPLPRAGTGPAGVRAGRLPWTSAAPLILALSALAWLPFVALLFSLLH